jgi:NADH dehydrogenase FAD-containing subunit
MSSEPSSRPSVVVLGGGYGGINVAKALDDVADVTLVDPKSAFVHNVAAWRALVEPEWLDRIFLPYDKLLAHGTFVQDSATAVDGRRVTLASGTVLEPDYLVLATGSHYPFPAKSDEPDTETARSRYRTAHQALLGAERVLIVGAGPAGLEVAGEIKAAFPGKQVTIADSAGEILDGPYKQELRDELHRQLAELGVELVLGSPLRSLPDAAPATLAPISIATEDGRELQADIWFRAFGVDLQTAYLEGGLAAGIDGTGHLHVDQNLRVPGADNVFAVGDIVDADRDMAGFASFQAVVVAGNIRSLITGEGELATYERWPSVIIIPLGPKGGAGQLPGQDEIAGPELASGIKGEHMLLASYAELFGVASPEPA